MQLRYPILFWFLLTGFCSLAQPPLDWVDLSSNGGTYNDYIEDVFVDAAGNTYACGSFKGSLSVGSNNLFASYAGQAFVVKYDNTGAVQWVVESDGNSQAFGMSIFVDNAGATYVAGYHTHSILSFSGVNLASSSSEGFFLLKINASGLPIHITGPTFASTGKSQALGVTGNGNNVFIIGSHRGPLSLPGGPTLPATQGGSDVFVAKVDSALSTFAWAFSHGGSSDDYATGLTIDGNNLYGTGNYGAATCTFNAGTNYVLPNYGNDAIWTCRFNAINGNLDWATSGGSAIGASYSNDVTVNSGQVFVVGGCSDVTKFALAPSFTGPFTYNDTIYSNGELDAFAVRYNQGGTLQSKWSNGGIGTDEAFGVAVDLTCSTVQICGAFEDSVNFGGTPLIALDKDIFVAATDNSGFPIWAFQQTCENDGYARSISTKNGISAVGGGIRGDGFFTTIPMTLPLWNGYRDYFAFRFNCSSTFPCGPSIDICQQNDTVVAPLLSGCTHVIGDYTAVPVTDGCMSGGITVDQSPASGNLLSAGVHLVNLTAVDLVGTKDVCFFNLYVKASSDARVATCGDVFLNETTGGDGNNYTSFSCSSLSTPGQDAFYQVTVEEDNQYLQIKLENAVDANDEYIYLYWLSNDCYENGNCSQVDSFNVATDQFSNNSPYINFTAPGPGTYYLVLDAKVDSIEQYDISFYCASSGIELDKSGCDPDDTDLDGIVASVNGSTVDLTMQPCESVDICHDLFIKNEDDWEWVDSIEFKLGECYENIDISAYTPTSGYHDNSGQWDGVYNAGSNSITWLFTHSTGNDWGDGDTLEYFCKKYSFCFSADITSTCSSSEGLTVGVLLADDGGKGIAPPSQLFELGNSNDFILQDDNPYFSYHSTVLCNADPDTIPDSISTAGGLFTATAGIVFTDGSPSPTGEIDLTNSTIGGPYTITHTVGLCPHTYDFILDINAQEDPAFSFGAAAYCQGDTDPTPTVTGTLGGTFTGPTEIVFISATTGQIDLDASTAGGPYYITYTTPGPDCINADSVQVTINAEDDPSFNYAQNAYCQGDTDPIPTITGTTGGTFNVLGGLNLISPSTGELDVSASALGGPYTVEYTTPGPDCPNTGNFQITINAEDDPTFSYPAAVYCQGDANPSATITGTTGGTFSGPAQIVFVSTSTGEVDLANSTAGGPYTITYTTPGPDCPNSLTFDITINAEDDPSFNFTSTIFCAADVNQIPTITGTSGGTFSGPVEINFVNVNTGEIDVTASTIGGPYTITYTTPGPDCPNSSDVIINISLEDDPTMSYLSTTYCSSDQDPQATVALAGGTFTGPTEIIFTNSTTGIIDLDASTAGGPYEIVYTSPGPDCPNTDTAYITILQQDDPQFSYSSTDLCEADSIELIQSLATSGGTFSADAGVNIDPSSGQLNLYSSTPGGPYTIKYLTQGTCPDSSEVQVIIYPEVIADAGPDQSLFLINETTLAGNTLPSTDSGTWTILTGSATITDINDPNSAVTDLQNGTTELLWTVSNMGCPQQMDTLMITAGELFIPQAITPNSDGQNDLFVVDGLDQLENTVEIFNRWGQKVFDSVNYQNDWDGTDASGNALSNDTYFYIIKVLEETYKGYLVIKR